METEINQLAMKAQFRIEVSGSDEPANWTAAGFDGVAYMISPNPGEPLKPVEQIASGGELSRVMLALKATIEAGKKSKGGTQRTLVFDEIDTGIGGRAAEAVGKKLKSLARANQVLCITHLPQIASFADHHYLIEKRESGGAHQDIRPPAYAGRADGRNCAHVERRDVDGDIAPARGAVVEGERMKCVAEIAADCRRSERQLTADERRSKTQIRTGVVTNCAFRPSISSCESKIMQRRPGLDDPSDAQSSSNAFLAIFWGGLACGVFDITQACIAWGIQNHLPPMRIFQSVASGLLGPKSFQGGAKTAALGLFLHFLHRIHLGCGLLRGQPADCVSNGKAGDRGIALWRICLGDDELRRGAAFGHPSLASQD